MERAPHKVVIVGGGPGGYEAALVAAQLGAKVTVVDSDGLGGSAVLTDCVPSKTLIATAELMTDMSDAAELGVRITDHEGDAATTFEVDLRAGQQAGDAARCRTVRRHRASPGEARTSRSSSAVARSAGVDRVVVAGDGGERILRADAVLVATGAAPRILPTAQPDGERILTWEQVYDLDEVPSHLVVVGSGVTGAEFASAYLSLGIEVTLVSSRDRVLPGEDADAAAVLEDVLTRRGMNVLSKSRMASVERHGDSVDGHPHRRPDRRGLALHPGAGLGGPHPGHGPRGGRGRARRRRVRRGRPGVPYLGARRVRRRRLHRRPHARLRGGHAGPDRDVALPRRRGRAARPGQRVVERLHRPRDRHRRRSPSGPSTPARCRSSR